MKLANTCLSLFLTLALVACGGDSDGGGGDKKADGDTGGGGATAKKAIDASMTGSVTGTIKWEGDSINAPEIDTSKDPKCHHEEPLVSETVTVNENGTLRDVIVWVDKSSLSDWEIPDGAGSVNLDQKGCKFIPHTLAVQAGQTVSITNSDNTKHNVNLQTKKNGSMNETQNPGDGAITFAAELPELAAAQCDIHGWMKANIAIIEHPFFDVSRDAGTYEIKGLPAGTYKIVVWHERFKSKPQTVTVKAGEASTLDFTFSAN